MSRFCASPYSRTISSTHRLSTGTPGWILFPVTTALKLPCRYPLLLCYRFHKSIPSTCLPPIPCGNNNECPHDGFACNVVPNVFKWRLIFLVFGYAGNSGLLLFTNDGFRLPISLMCLAIHSASSSVSVIGLSNLTNDPDDVPILVDHIPNG